jgi:hypothetical protein
VINFNKIILPAVFAVFSLTINGCELSEGDAGLDYPVFEEPVRGLESFMERHGEKPYELFLRGGEAVDPPGDL